MGLRVQSMRKRMSNDELVAYRKMIVERRDALGDQEQTDAELVQEGIYVEMMFRNDRVI